MDAYESLSGADQAGSLEAGDLELLATSAYMLGRDDEYVSGLERAHHAYLDRGELLRAVRCAFWIGINLTLRGEMGRASGWLGRARRLVDREGRDCVEQGYLLVPLMFERQAAGDYEAAIAAAAEAVAIGERFGDADLFALAAQAQGILLVKQGRVVEGLGLLDEAMVAVTAGELSPIVNGFVYCGVISGCQAAYEPRRAQEWTAALTSWCEQQPDMVSFTGTCLVHRAEIMQLHGAWPEALEEARRAGERCALAMNESAAAEALYRQGELHRLQGELGIAENDYRNARRGGYEPQPGLALLRLAQGNRRGRRRRDPPPRGRDLRAVEACWAAARLRRDHAGGRRCPGGAQRVRGAPGDRRALAGRHDGGHGRARSGSGRPRRGRRRGGSRRAASRGAGVAGAGGTVRGGTHTRAGRPGLRRAGRRRHRRVGARRGPRGASHSSERRQTLPASIRSPAAARPSMRVG